MERSIIILSLSLEEAQKTQRFAAGMPREDDRFLSNDSRDVLVKDEISGSDCIFFVSVADSPVVELPLHRPCRRRESLIANGKSREKAITVSDVGVK